MKPSIGINQDRFNTIAMREAQQERIRNLIEEKRAFLPDKYNDYQWRNNSGERNNSLGVGNQIQYFNRLYP